MNTSISTYNLVKYAGQLMIRAFKKKRKKDKDHGREFWGLRAEIFPNP